MCNCRGGCSCSSNSAALPIGPQGPAGTDGVDGADGAPGTNGTNGTNAFKFVKVFTTDDIEQALAISYDDLTSCEEFPDTCVMNGEPDFPDLHVQVWLYSTDVFNHWELLTNKTDYLATVNATNGQIVINTANNMGTYRVVVIG